LSGCSTTGGSARSHLPSNWADIPDAVPKAEPKSKFGNPKSYVVFGKRYHTLNSSEGYEAQGIASWYGPKFDHRRTSSGAEYNMYAMTAAHKTLPLPTFVRVTNLDNGRTAVVKVNDRGPFYANRLIDLSYAAARKLGIVAAGTAPVDVRAIDPAHPRPDANFLVSKSLPHVVPIGSKSEPKIAHSRAKAATKVAATATKPEPRLAAASRRGVLSASSQAVYLQVGAFGRRSNAEHLRERLLGHLAEHVLVSTADKGNKTLYKVHIGPLYSRAKAERVSRKLLALGLTQPEVIAE
jgi:rare lipoprotein A